jgi:AmiR/NasT family two-component response regulator
LATRSARRDRGRGRVPSADDQHREPSEAARERTGGLRDAVEWAAGPAKGRTVTIRVVIAEDEAIIRMDLRETLEEEGYEVVGETGRGDTAVELVRDLLPDLAILDIKMPGIDGLEAARIINAEKLCGVLVLTAFSQREVVEEARDAGALAYLVKPFQKSDLVPAIEVAIGRFRELRAMTGEIDALGEQLEARKSIERAKGVLMDELKMSEQDAFTFIQRTAMSERSKMRQVADRIIDGSLRPTTS